MRRGIDPELEQQLRQIPVRRPRQTFVQQLERNLIQKAQRMKRTRRVRKYVSWAIGSTIPAVFALWLFIGPGWQMLFEADSESAQDPNAMGQQGIDIPEETQPIDPIQPDDENIAGTNINEDDPDEQNVQTTERDNRSDEEIIRDQAEQIVQALHVADFAAVAEFVHRVKGVRISPYAWVDVDEHRLLTREEVQQFLQDTQVYEWGTQDGSGFSIDLTPDEYYDRWIYFKDFAQPDEINYHDDIQPRGNSLHNYADPDADIFPDAVFIEYFVADHEDVELYGGMHWGSLILGFEPFDGKWYLVALINDRHTM